MRGVSFLAVGFAFALPSTAQAFGSCMDDGYLAAFLTGTAPQDCEERETFTLRHGRGTSTVRVISLSAVGHVDDAVWIDRIGRNIAAIGDAMRSMGNVGTEDITILLAPAVSAEGWQAEAGGLMDAENRSIGECAATVYKVPAGYDEREFDFVLAHELFHCAQYVSFPGADAKWWSEGSAEHFAHMAVPDAGDFGWYQAFDYRSAETALTAMEYENVVFFHWLQQQDGPEGLARFLASVAAGDDVAALRARIDTAAMAAFTEAYVEGRITSPGGTAVPAPGTFTGEYLVDREATLPLEAEPFVAQRYRLTFAKDKHYDIRLSGADGAEVRMQDENAAWSNLPLIVSACPEEVTRLAYAVTVDGPVSGEITIFKEGPEGPGACCLEGEWTATPETLAGLAAFGNDVGGPAVAMAGGEMSCSYAGGDVRLTFRADGTGALGFDGHATDCVASMQGQRFSTGSTRSGRFDFDWTTKSETAGMATYTDNSVAWNIDIRIGPVVQTMSAPDDGPATASNGFAFVCSPTTLEILGIYGLSHKENQFTRPSPP